MTAVPRTLVDLAAVLSAYELAKACHEAEFRYRTTPAQVSEVLARRPNSPGAASLRSILTGEAKISLSPVELDSYTFHNSRHSWEQDGKRARQAHARGDEFRRYTWGDVFESPRLMLRELVTALRPEGS